jgi:FkbM family methyltransferase
LHLLSLERLRRDEDADASRSRLLTRHLRAFAADARRLAEVGVPGHRIGGLWWLVSTYVRMLAPPTADPRRRRVWLQVGSTPIEVVHRNNSSDRAMIVEVLIRSAYRLPPDVSLPEAPTIVDLGANAGFSAAYLNACHPSARMVLVEPVDESASVAEANATTNGWSWTIDRVAVSDRTGPVDLYVNGWWASCTIKEEVASRRSRWGRPEATLDRGVRQVPGTTVAELLDRHHLSWVDVMKVDIEGAEIDAITDGAAWLQSVGTILIELHHKDLDASTVRYRLEDAGFVRAAGFRSGRCEAFYRPSDPT